MEDEVWKECIFDFRDIPTKCDVCGSDKIRYTSNAEIYHGKQYGNGYCYLCDNCGASVGVHNAKSKKPLGRFATKEMKQLKMKCHSKFDLLWKKYNFFSISVCWCKTMRFVVLNLIKSLNNRRNCAATVPRFFRSPAWVPRKHQAIVKLFVLVNNSPVKNSVRVAGSAVVCADPLLL